MAETKTRPTTVAVEAFIAGVDNPGRREDAKVLVTLLEDVTGEPATMWGPSIIGFGRYRYRYASGHEGDAALVGFSPRKANLVLYLAPDEADRETMLARLGKHKSGKGCLYVNRLSDVDAHVLRELASATVVRLKTLYPEPA